MHHLKPYPDLAPWGLLPPRTLTVAVTDACNLDCAHCWKCSGGRSPSRHAHTGELLRILGEFRALGGEGVRLTGGEPLCHPDWLELLRFCVAQGFSSVALQTNGLLFDAERVAALARLDFPGLSIQLSLDGATRETHDLVRGEGAFDGVLRGIGLLGQGGLAPRLSIFMTEMRHNLEEIPELLALAQRLGVGSVSTGMLVSCGRAAKGALQPPEPSQYLGLVRRFREDPEFRERYGRMGCVAALEWSCGAQAPREPCNFVTNLYLTAQGVLYPCVLCHADPYAVTGVLSKRLADALLEGAPLWSRLLGESGRRAETIESCRDCSERESCGGGCPGRAFGSFGSVMAADDRCESRRELRSLAAPPAPEKDAAA